MNRRADILADRIEQGACELADLTGNLSESEWQTIVPNEARPVNVLVHHVASMYPAEIELARTLAAGKPVEGLTWEVIDQINAEHHEANIAVSGEEALDLLQRNSRLAADAIRQFSDEDLDRAAPVSLNFDAPLTAGFFIEDHALRHSFQHIASIRRTIKG